MSNYFTCSDRFTVQSDKCQYTDNAIISDYTYETTIVNGNVITIEETKMKFRTERTIPKLGVMLVGLGGNNGCTCVAGAIANKLQMTWETKEGTKSSNFWGSLLLASTVKLGNDPSGNSIYTPFSNMLPMVDPKEIVWGGWDLSNMNLGDAMKRSRVLDYNLQQKLYPYMKDIVPLPSIYIPDFIAANQSDRVTNVLVGTKQQQMEIIQQNIRDFKIQNELDKVIVLWTANTERFCSIENGLNDTADSLLQSIRRNEHEVSPSTLFATASILEGCTFINGSPQNTCVPGILDLARQHKVFVAGDDFKSGQTKMKSVLIDYLVSAGIKPVSIVSYNHLGNNDGKNLSAPSQFRSKEISKSNVVDDMVGSNKILYDDDEHPDHVVVIKYVPYVGDSKRAMDEYTSEIFMGGTNTIVMHNTCEDSLLATPLIYDLVILAELCERISIKKIPSQQLQGQNPQQQSSTSVLSPRSDSSALYDATNGSWGKLQNGKSILKIKNGNRNGNHTIKNGSDVQDVFEEEKKQCDVDIQHEFVDDSIVHTEAAKSVSSTTIATVATVDDDEWESFHPVLSLLSYMLKAPVVPDGAPIVNALFTQRQAIVNVMRACLGLPAENHMTLEHRLESSLSEQKQRRQEQRDAKRCRTN